MEFWRVADYFARVEEHASRKAMTRELGTLLREVSPHEARIVSYLALGRMRAVYQETSFDVGAALTRRIVAGVTKHSADTVAEGIRRAGDAGTFLREQQWSVDDSLSVEDVYAALAELETIDGKDAIEHKVRRAVELLSSLRPLAASYVLRMMRGKLRLGFSDMTLLDAFSWMLSGDTSYRSSIEHAYNISADIGALAYTLKTQGIDALGEWSITPGVPIRPASAERLPNARAIYDKIGACALQPKLDGFRLQVHVCIEDSGVACYFFSRNLLPLHDIFPEIETVFREHACTSFIVEGEAIAYDVESQQYLPFQETVKRRRKYDITQMATDVPLRFVVFDVLHHDGRSLLALSHMERFQKMQQLFSAYPLPLSCTPQACASSAEDIEDYFDAQISAGLEGIVAKRLQAPYQAGKRNFNWIKLKRRETGHLEDTLDLVVLGYYYGKGKRAQFGIGSFLVGAYNAKTEMFETMAKVGTGLSDEQWQELRRRCDAMRVPHKPPYIACHKDLIPDVWVQPSDVVAVQADEITLSPVHTAGKDASRRGYALRFPRFCGYVPDKGPYDVTTLEEVRRLYEDQV